MTSIGRKDYARSSSAWTRVGLMVATLLIGLTALLMPSRAFAAIAQGTCGTSAWSIDDEGMLTIGSGVLASNDVEEPDSGSTTTPGTTPENPGSQVPEGAGAAAQFYPWYRYVDQIKGVTIEAGAKGGNSIKYLLSGCINLTTADVANLDTSSVSDMSNVFLGCTSLTELDLSAWSTSSLTKMSGLFSGCTKLASLNISGWNTSKVTEMSSVFLGCTGLTSLDVSGWNTSNVTNMNALFSGCTGLTSLDVANWNTSKVTNMQATFSACSGLTALDVSKWSTASVTNMQALFSGCTKLTSLDVSKWNTSAVTNMQGVFTSCMGLTSLDVSKWNTAAVTTMNALFSGCTGLTSLDVSSWNTAKVTDMQATFGACTGIKTLDLSKWNVSSVTSMTGMFTGCSALTSVNTKGWNTSAVKDMQMMFSSCSSLETLDLSGWDTRALTNMRGMFSNCTSLETLKVAGWNTSMVTDMDALFAYCTGLKSLDLSGWDTANVAKSSYSSILGMYSNCKLDSWTVGTAYVMKYDFMVPNPTGEEGKWWSTADKAWFTKNEIMSSRSGIADTYTSVKPAAKMYTITFVNWDGAELSSKKYEEGTAASAITKPANPTRPATEDNVYTFSGWTPTITSVTQDATYTATYSVSKAYTITFVDWDGTVISRTRYAEGTSGSDIVKPTNPTRIPSAQYTYVFSGWTPTIGMVTKDATYTAVYLEYPLDVKAEWVRLSGNGRYDTMAAIVDAGFKTSDWAVVATGKEFPDALVAASVAGAKGCPVVLTAPNKLSDQAKAKLKSLKVKYAYVMGGTGAVSDNVLESLSDLGIEPERISGSSRYATSLAALNEIKNLGKFNGTVVVATGTNFADALSIGPWCFETATPILLTNKNGKLTNAQVQACKGIVKKVIIVGGAGAVSDEVVEDLDLIAGIDSIRLAGSNRYETSKKIAEWELYQQGMTMQNAAVATGQNFPDALAGAALCGSNSSPLLLVKNEKSVTLDLVTKSAGIKVGYVLGGTGAVSADLMEHLRDLTK